ncbi:MAG: hypothetical protein II992_09660 [Lachnospiraceae bacterium]|nr:hypothetical protein [Lachnospiraceae bacterium]
MFCGKCGKEILKVTAYCPQCGNKLDQESTKEKATFTDSKNTQPPKRKNTAAMQKLNYKKIVVGFGILFGMVVIGAGVFKVVNVLGTKSEHIEVANLPEVTEQTTKKRTAEDTKEQKTWDLFQKTESTFGLTEEEKAWVFASLEKVYKGTHQAKWEEGLFSFHVLGNAQKQENRVSVDVVCCTHPIYFKQYVTQVQYLKLEFSVEQEPELKEIQVRVCNSEGNSFTKAKASSVCGEQRNAVSENKEICYYKAENVVDEDETTAWIEGDKKGYGKGEWISLSATKKKKICGIAIRNGYTKSDRTMERNAQVKKVTVTCSDGSSQVYKLQKNTYATGVEKWYSDCILFEQPVDAKKITLTIESVYKGKRFYEYWDEGKEYYSQNSIACKDTCISEIKVLTMPEDDLYEAEEIKVVQEEENHYDSWQQAYLQALEQPQNVMARYNENMKLYVDEYKSLQGTLDQRYNEEGMLHLPNSGFLEDINGDSVPELFLIHATESPEDNEGIFAECVAHVFTFDMKDKCRLYCGSFVTRYDENEGEETFFYKDQRDDSLRAYLSYGVGEAEGTHYYSFFGLKENKLAWNKLLEWKQTIKRDNSSITIRCRKKDYLSITKEEFEQEYENDARYLTRVELLTLEELEECVQ